MHQRHDHQPASSDGQGVRDPLLRGQDPSVGYLILLHRLVRDCARANTVAAPVGSCEQINRASAAATTSIGVAARLSRSRIVSAPPLTEPKKSEPCSSYTASCPAESASRSTSTAGRRTTLRSSWPVDTKRIGSMRLQRTTRCLSSAWIPEMFSSTPSNDRMTTTPSCGRF